MTNKEIEQLKYQSKEYREFKMFQLLNEILKELKKQTKNILMLLIPTLSTLLLKAEMERIVKMDLTLVKLLRF